MACSKAQKEKLVALHKLNAMRLTDAQEVCLPLTETTNQPIITHSRLQNKSIIDSLSRMHSPMDKISLESPDKRPDWNVNNLSDRLKLEDQLETLDTNALIEQVLCKLCSGDPVYWHDRPEHGPELLGQLRHHHGCQFAMLFLSIRRMTLEGVVDSVAASRVERGESK